MKQMSLSKVAIAASTFTFATLLSLGWCEQGGVSLSVGSAQARVGRPMTPISGAGVARRQVRRDAYGYGAGPVAGAAAVGTAAVVGAATSPWGPGYYGGSPYYGGGGWGAGYGAPYAAGPGGPYSPYGRPMNANVAAGPGAPPAGWGGLSNEDRALYIKNLHDSGYNPKDNFNSNGTVKTQ